MTPTIWLASDPPDADYGPRPFAVVAPGRRGPPGMPAVSVTEAEAFRASWGDGTEVIVGISRIFTPSNRCAMHELFHRPRAGLRRVSVDDRLFVGQPWRMLWHFLAVDVDYAGLTDSYLAESRWLRAEAERTPCPFSLDRVIRYGRGHVVSVDPYVHGDVLVEEHATSADVRARYNAEKEAAFEHEKTLPAILRRLVAVADNALPTRRIPTLTQVAGFPRGASIRIVRTDLPVDRFQTERLRAAVTLTNGIAAEFAS